MKIVRKVNKDRAMLIYRTMIEFQHENDFSMTTRDIATKLNLASNSDIAFHVRYLIDNGYAKIRGKQIRAIPQ